jgi:hypothetical protein
MRLPSILVAAAAAGLVIAVEASPAADPGPHYLTTWRFEVHYNDKGLKAVDTDPQKEGDVTMPVGMHWTCTRDKLVVIVGGLAAGFKCRYIDSSATRVLTATALAACSPTKEDSDLSHVDFIESGSGIGGPITTSSITLFAGCVTRRI